MERNAWRRKFLLEVFWFMGNVNLRITQATTSDLVHVFCTSYIWSCISSLTIDKEYRQIQINPASYPLVMYMPPGVHQWPLYLFLIPPEFNRKISMTLFFQRNISPKDEEWEKIIEDAPEQKICNYAGDSSWGTPALFLVNFKLISSISRLPIWPKRAPHQFSGKSK